jgi:hypothetical protein
MGEQSCLSTWPDVIVLRGWQNVGCKGQAVRAEEHILRDLLSPEWPHRIRGKWFYFIYLNARCCGPGSPVGIATDYGLDGPGIESRWGARFSAPVQTGPGAHPASCTMGTGSFPGVKCGRGVLLTTHILLVPRSWKSRAIPPSTLWATPGL